MRKSACILRVTYLSAALICAMTVGVDAQSLVPVEARSQVAGRFSTFVAAPNAAIVQSSSAQRTGRDSVLDGVLIGAGIGALAGLIPDHYDDCEECHDSLYASIAVGAGVGLIVDLLRGRKPMAPPRARNVQLGASFPRHGAGVVGRVRWR